METETQIFIQDRDKRLFSRGILAKKLRLLGIPSSAGYEISIQVYNEIARLKETNIEKNILDDVVFDILKSSNYKECADKYMLVEKWKASSMPLWILIAGAIGVGKSTLSQKIAGDLGIQHVIGTDVVRDILRKILSVDVMPELHSPSYSAYKTLRPIYSSRFEEVLLGFENHSKYVNLGVEAVLSRAATESVSIIIEGEHLLPALFDETILSQPNVLYMTIAIPDPLLHKENLSSQYTKERDDLINHFNDIRKIHDHIVNETRIRKLPVVETSRDLNPLDTVRKIVVDKIVSMVTTKS
jgi:2-phosphoglycerate kinase